MVKEKQEDMYRVVVGEIYCEATTRTLALILSEMGAPIGTGVEKQHDLTSVLTDSPGFIFDCGNGGGGVSQPISRPKLVT